MYYRHKFKINIDPFSIKGDAILSYLLLFFLNECMHINIFPVLSYYFEL